MIRTGGFAAFLRRGGFDASLGWGRRFSPLLPDDTMWTERMAPGEAIPYVPTDPIGPFPTLGVERSARSSKMRARQQSSTSNPYHFRMVRADDRITAVTGLTPTMTISKNGAAFASPSGAITELGNGWYSWAGNATDRNTLGELIVHVTGTDAVDWDDVLDIVDWNPMTDDFTTTIGTINTNAGLAATSATTLLSALVAVDTTAIGGGDTTHVRVTISTGASVDIYNGLTLVIGDASTGDVVARRISDYSPGPDEFTVEPALPFTPDAGDQVYVLTIPWDQIVTRLPATLVSGRIDASVGAMAANVLTASALAADAGAEIADAVLDEALSGHTTAGTLGEAMLIARGGLGYARIDGGSGNATVQYNGDGLATQIRVRIFATEVASAAATLGAADGADSELLSLVGTAVAGALPGLPYSIRGRRI